MYTWGKQVIIPLKVELDRQMNVDEGINEWVSDWLTLTKEKKKNGQKYEGRLAKVNVKAKQAIISFRGKTDRQVNVDECISESKHD